MQNQILCQEELLGGKDFEKDPRDLFQVIVRTLTWRNCRKPRQTEEGKLVEIRIRTVQYESGQCFLSRGTYLGTCLLNYK